MEKSLSLLNLTVNRGYLTLLEDLSLHAKPGEGFHITGPNGSGKTSLFLTIAGLIRPRSGQIVFGNAPLMSEDFHWSGTKPAMKGELSVWDNLKIWARIEEEPFSTLTPYLSRYKLHGTLQKPFKILSKGQQQRVTLLKLFLKPKPIWLLDEPFANLDQESLDLFCHDAQAHMNSGGIILLSAHQPVPLSAITSIDLRDFQPPLQGVA